MKSIYAIALTSILLACGQTEELVETTEQREPDHTEHSHHSHEVDTVASIEETHSNVRGAFNVSISFSHHGSYCGGMAPDPETLAALHYPLRNTYFILIDRITGQNEKVKTDTAGMLYLNLTPGKYAIRETFKDVSFEDFFKQFYQEPGMYYQDSGKDCYKSWWESNLAEFEIIEGDSVYHYDLTTYDRCFTGNNPCIMYIGPYPP